MSLNFGKQGTPLPGLIDYVQDDGRSAATVPASASHVFPLRPASEQLLFIRRSCSRCPTHASEVLPSFPETPGAGDGLVFGVFSVLCIGTILGILVYGASLWVVAVGMSVGRV